MRASFGALRLSWLSTSEKIEGGCFLRQVFFVCVAYVFVLVVSLVSFLLLGNRLELEAPCPT